MSLSTTGAMCYLEMSMFLLYHVDARVRVRRLQGEALNKYCVQYTIVGGGG